MALTEEYMQMKVNGDSNSAAASSSAAGDNEDSNGNHSSGGNSNNNPIPRLTDTLISSTSNMALSTVKTLAGAVGSAGNDSNDDDYSFNYDTTNANGMGAEDEDYATADGFNKGAFGIANVLSGRRPTSRRSRLLKWQRQNLAGVRREIAMSSFVRKSGGIVGSTSINGGGGGDGDSGGRMTPLVAALPSSKKKNAKNANNRGRNNNGNNNDTTNDDKLINSKKDQTLIAAALQTLEKDMALLDNFASSQSQLSGAEVGLLLGAVLASGLGPIAFPGTSVTEVLAPAAAAFTASITIGSEYLGRVAVADGKEIAANSIQCAAEAEGFLANAERVKAITPLCVGVGATCASFAILAPTIIDALNIGGSVIMVTELYLFFPLVSVLAAAVSNLALEETRGFASRAINVGVRRFSSSGTVGRSWLSTSEQVVRNSKSKTDRWWSFAGSVLPAPILGSVVGGPSLSAKCIIIALLAAAQSAYFLAQAERVVARATDAVALKARSAAVCDTYANQGARNSAILPFTSALSAFCAAATAATVELPFLETISTLYGTMGEVAVVSTFPVLSSAFAAAAAVSKARCEVDAEAAAQAASTLALEYDSMEDDDPVMRPFQTVWELVGLAVTSGWRSIKRGVVEPFGNLWRVGRRAIFGFRWRRRSDGSNGKMVEGGEGLV